MPEPISSVSPPCDLSCHSPSDEEPLLGSLPSGACPLLSQSSKLNEEPEGPAGAGVPAGAAVLTQSFQHDHYAFIAAATVDASPTASASRAPASISAALPPNPDDQLNLQVGIPRIERQLTLSSVHLTGAVDVLNANAHLGSQNDDGSQGENIGAGATLVGAEVTADYKGWSLTLGVASSLGASVSSGGGRDLDGDGKPERCFKASYEFLTLGVCDEL